MDNSPASIALVKRNLQICGMQAAVVRADALSYLEHCGRFDLVFIDPPYHAGLYDKILQSLFRFDILNDGGIILVESMRGEPMPPAVPPYIPGRSYRYGKLSLTTYRRQAP